MITIKLIYLLTYTLAFCVGVFVYKHHKALYILLGLIALGLCTEYAVNITNYIVGNRVYEPFIYNCYIPLEYLGYTHFFYTITVHLKLKKLIVFMVLPYLIVFWLTSDLFYITIPKQKLATTAYIVGGLITTAWSIFTLFLIKPLKKVTFIQHPLFWICTGLIVFYSGMTPFNKLFEYLKDTNEDTFKQISNIIRKGLNIIFYCSIIIGFLCSHRIKKYLKL